jgi:cell division inhibitor SepF
MHPAWREPSAWREQPHAGNSGNSMSLASGHAEVLVITPNSLEEAHQAVLAVRDRRVVVLQAGHLEPEEAQRTIDFVAGGVSAMDGRAERLDETTFVFTPSTVNLSHL